MRTRMRTATSTQPAAAVCLCGCCSSDELGDTTGLSDTLLGDLAEHLGANDEGGLGQLALAADLEEAL